MRSGYATVGLLGMALLLATGAAVPESGLPAAKSEALQTTLPVRPVDATQQAADWQRTADIALANNQFLVAYSFYQKIAQAYPGSRVARQAASRGNYCLHRLQNPDRYPTWEDWWRELYDALVW